MTRKVSVSTLRAFILPYPLFQRSIVFFHVVKQMNVLYSYLLIGVPALFTFVAPEGLMY